MGSSTARGSSSASHLRGDDVAFSSTGTRSAPRNSIRFAARYPAHGLCERFELSLTASPRITRGRGGWLGLTRGRLAPPILCQRYWRTPERVRLGHPYRASSRRFSVRSSLDFCHGFNVRAPQPICQKHVFRRRGKICVSVVHGLRLSRLDSGHVRRRGWASAGRMTFQGKSSPSLLIGWSPMRVRTSR
jgi:hypothetical protein